jgi:secreted trypsin-like serine protease
MKPSNKIQKMKVTVIVTLMALSLIVVLPAKAITWGEADESQHPNVGAMVVRWSDGTLGQVCSGTLIHPYIFLTAGHCTDYLEYVIGSDQIAAIYVNFDEDALNESTLLDVETFITHPDYNWGPQSNPHDVGILILEEPLLDITPATLPYEGFLDDLRAAGELRKGKEEADFTVVGYGATLYWPPPKFTYESKRQYAESEYQALLKSWLRMSQNQRTGDGGTCYGDSGGPAFWTDPDTGEEILVGITSWGDVPCVAAGFNYRVDTADTLGFIAWVADKWLGRP